MDMKWSMRRTAGGPVRADLQRLHAGTVAGTAGTLCQRTELPSGRHLILSALELPAPSRVLTATSD